MFFGWDDPLATAGLVAAGLFALKVTLLEAIDTYATITERLDKQKERRREK